MNGRYFLNVQQNNLTSEGPPNPITYLVTVIPRITHILITYNSCISYKLRSTMLVLWSLTRNSHLSEIYEFSKKQLFIREYSRTLEIIFQYKKCTIEEN
uniref:Uncharacterized protein n=1 Tax=Hyaloperonospora arabidopsidis (strain Emoy2) TaxID=559515 RepID=M4BHB8_HYAAE